VAKIGKLAEDWRGGNIPRRKIKARKLRKTRVGDQTDQAEAKKINCPYCKKI